MRAVLTVIGHDRVGIIAGVSSILAECNVNIRDISQTIMQDLFTMIMLLETSNASVSFSELSDRLAQKGEELEVSVRLQHEEIFNSMHRI